MGKRNTKKIILEEALDLFSLEGYAGVGVRAIAKRVGIKESSIYKHFKSKEDIFNSLLAEMEERYQQAALEYQLPQGDIDEVADSYQTIDLDSLKKLSRQLFLFFLKDPYASKFRRMLENERHKNIKAKEMYQSLFIDDGLSFQGNIFAQLIAKGAFVESDPQIVALHFYAPIFLMFQKYDDQPEMESQALSMLDAHVE
ncbi:TetR/AcrR family transcriptional regulator, partial [Breznakia sp. OttesenSCG-928-G09]|nr:TetR/AcrR family transcriptional regulator [Breznakia sp. OttesenSCG-928-G09]